jgi:hypothetical protein
MVTALSWQPVKNMREDARNRTYSTNERVGFLIALSLALDCLSWVTKNQMTRGILIPAAKYHPFSIANPISPPKYLLCLDPPY